MNLRFLPALATLLLLCGCGNKGPLTMAVPPASAPAADDAASMPEDTAPPADVATPEPEPAPGTAPATEPEPQPEPAAPPPADTGHG